MRDPSRTATAREDEGERDEDEDDGAMTDRHTDRPDGNGMGDL